jgi:hypothetical protein
MPTIRPLHFFTAQANRQFTMNSGIVRQDQFMFVAKWKGLYVLATDASNFFVTTAEKAAEYARTLRGQGRRLLVAENAPVIRPIGPQFEWHVEAGRNDDDRCDEGDLFTQLVADLNEARALVATLKTTRFTDHNHHFLRIRGPAFYSYERPPVPPPPPPRPRSVARPYPVDTINSRIRNMNASSYSSLRSSWDSAPMYNVAMDMEINDSISNRMNTEYIRRAASAAFGDPTSPGDPADGVPSAQAARETIVEALRRLDTLIEQDRQRRINEDR